jgi:diaminopimelate epimerase
MEKEKIEHIDFLKMSGAGNDFVVIDNRRGTVMEPVQFARVVCDRRRGVGADGLLLLENSKRSDFQMKYYNADGSYGGMCGNGGRCISRFAYLKEIVASEEIKFEALDHVYRAQLIKDKVKLTMKNPSEIRLNQMLPMDGLNVIFHYIDTGSPHCVILLDQNKNIRETLRDLDVYGIGKTIRHHKSFSPNGTNVNFVERIDSNTIRIRTYERGVEAETLACGTGSVASAIMANQISGVSAPVVVLMQSGESLQVDFQNRGMSVYEDVSLFGSAHVTFAGAMRYNPSTHTIVDQA